MRKTFLTLTLAAFLFSCKDKTKKSIKYPVKLPVIVIADNGSRQLVLLYREIGEDTSWFSLEERKVGEIDSVGKPKVDSSGKYIVNVATQRTSVDKARVIYDFSLGVDSLLNVKDLPTIKK